MKKEFLFPVLLPMLSAGSLGVDGQESVWKTEGQHAGDVSGMQPAAL